MITLVQSNNTLKDFIIRKLEKLENYFLVTPMYSNSNSLWLSANRPGIKPGAFEIIIDEEAMVIFLNKEIKGGWELFCVLDDKADDIIRKYKEQVNGYHQY